MEMTMRQVAGLLKIIGRSDLVQFYNQLLSYGTVHGLKLPSFEEFLTLSSGKDPEAPTSFSEDADKKLEAVALKRLEERKRLAESLDKVTERLDESVKRLTDKN